jgi:hypothetical protein
VLHQKSDGLSEILQAQTIHNIPEEIWNRNSERIPRSMLRS